MDSYSCCFCEHILAADVSTGKCCYDGNQEIEDGHNCCFGRMH